MASLIEFVLRLAVADAQAARIIEADPGVVPDPFVVARESMRSLIQGTPVLGSPICQAEPRHGYPPILTQSEKDQPDNHDDDHPDHAARPCCGHARRSQPAGTSEGTLSVHADRGSAMTSKAVSQLLADLCIGRTHSRPHVSNDNTYSEARFKTLKYCPSFPDRFGSIEHARAFAGGFFETYNHHHRHSGIGYHTPASVHFGTAAVVRAGRAKVLDAAYVAHPERFVHGKPVPPPLPGPAWINKPKEVEGQSIA
jgi:hypothetical protein